MTLASSVAQQPRLIVPALPSSMSQISGVTGATAAGNVQFPHGVLSGGVVYLPQVITHTLLLLHNVHYLMLLFASIANTILKTQLN